MIKDSIAPLEASLNAAPTGIWLRAVLRPSVATYERLVRQPYSGRRLPYIWILVSALIGGVLVSLDPLLAPLVRGQSFDTGLLPAIPIYALIATLFWAIFVGCTQAVARLLKGVGTFPQMAYASATFSAPLILVASALALLPWIAVPALLLYGYWLVLYVVALQAVNQFSRARAFGAVLISLLLCGCTLLGVVLLVAV